MIQERVLTVSTAGAEATVPAVLGRVVRRRWLYRVLPFLTLFGSGLIVMEADNAPIATAAGSCKGSGASAVNIPVTIQA